MRALAIFSGILLFLPGLCFGIFGISGLANMRVGVKDELQVLMLWLLMLLIAAFLIWAGIALMRKGGKARQPSRSDWEAMNARIEKEIRERGTGDDKRDGDKGPPQS
jgi:hypothetical protein